MEHIDARRLSQDAQYQIRRQVVRLRDKGMTYAEIAEIVDIYPSRVCTIFTRYERYGMVGIAKDRRGRSSRSPYPPKSRSRFAKR